MSRIEVTLELTPSAVLAAANQPNGLFHPLQNLIISSGGQSHFQLPSTGEGGNGGTLLHALNKEDFSGMVGHNGQAIVAPERTYHPVTFILHCGSRPMLNGVDNPFDMSGLLPATRVVELIAEWVTGLNSVIDDTVTLASAVARYKIYYLVGTNEQLLNEMIRQDCLPPVQGATCMVPQWTATPLALDTTYPDYSKVLSLPVGAYLKRIGILCQDATATRPIRAGDEITGIKVSLNTQDVCKEFTDAMSCKMQAGTFMVANDVVNMGGSHAPSGIYIKDLRPHGHPDYGLNLIGQQVGSPTLGLTVTTNAAGDDALILYERLVPHFEAIGQ